MKEQSEDSTPPIEIPIKENEDPTKKNWTQNWQFHLVWGSVLIIIVGLYVYLGFDQFDDSTPSDAGQFGDRFGAVNALFTGLSLAGLVLAILLQRQEIIQARTEFRAAWAQLQESRDREMEMRKIAERKEAELTHDLKRRTFPQLVLLARGSKKTSTDDKAAPIRTEAVFELDEGTIFLEGAVGNAVTRMEWPKNTRIVPGEKVRVSFEWASGPDSIKQERQIKIDCRLPFFQNTCYRLFVRLKAGESHHPEWYFERQQ